MVCSPPASKIQSGCVGVVGVMDIVNSFTGNDAAKALCSSFEEQELKSAVPYSGPALEEVSSKYGKESRLDAASQFGAEDTIFVYKVTDSAGNIHRVRASASQFSQFQV